MNEKNLKPFKKGEIASDVARERARNGARITNEKKKAKKTLAELFTIWAETEVSERNKEVLKSLGIESEDATNKALLIAPIIKGITKGDARTLQMAIELLSEDKKKETEIKKLNAEIKRLEMETEKLRKEINGDIGTEQIVIINDIPKTNDGN